MESLIQTHCGPPVVFIHIIDTFTFCFCLLSWIIFYLPEVNFFMTTAHFSLFLHGPIALVCMWMFVLEIRLKSIQPVHLCTVYMHICLLNILFDVNSYDWMLLGNHVKDSNLSEVNHISVFWKRKKNSLKYRRRLYCIISHDTMTRESTPSSVTKNKIQKNDDAMKIGVC